MRNYSLRTILAFSAVALAVTTTATLGFLAERTATKEIELRIGEQLARRTLMISDKIDRALAERYNDIELHAATLTEFDLLDRPAAVRNRLNRLAATYEGYAWIGYSNNNGKILAANEGLLEEFDISERPWFKGASKAAFVGDLHRALLLEKKLNANGAEPLRFLDIAMPVMDKDGTFAGVLGAHIDWRWIKGITESMPELKQAEVLIIGANNNVLLGPADLQDRPLLTESVRQAQKGHSNYQIEQWPDGKTYLIGYTQSKGYKDYPGLGWIVLERQEIDNAFSSIKALRHQFILWGVVIAALFASLGWLIASRISRPLASITRAAELLKRGQPKVKIPIMKGYREVAVLSRALSNLIAELTQREAELEHQATHHNLTQLPNRALIRALIEQNTSVLHERSRQIAVLMLDIDRFKLVNDALGHGLADMMLQAVAERLKNCIGASGTLGHISEDKFVLLIEEYTALLAQTTALANRLQQVIAEPFVLNDAEFFLSISIGISLFPKDADDAESLLGGAEIALREAKRKGGNRIEFYEMQMNAFILEQLDLERELRQALEQQQLELHYQPQMSFRTGAVVGVEALIRWRHPKRGFISPAKFIPIAEASGLIVPIGDWVLNKACVQAQEWRKQGLPPLRMGVNVSVQQFSEGRLVERVSSALARSGLEPANLKLEITESLLMQEVEHSITTMNELSDLGIHLAIDDFGTGYSSLSYLKRFPINELKIDQAFVRDLKLHSDDATIVRAIIGLGQNLKLSVIAEGVETAEQFNFLQQIGCDEMQGYYFSRPVPADELSAFLLTYTQNTCN